MSKNQLLTLYSVFYALSVLFEVVDTETRAVRCVDTASVCPSPATQRRCFDRVDGGGRISVMPESFGAKKRVPDTRRSTTIVSDTFWCQNTVRNVFPPAFNESGLRGQAKELSWLWNFSSLPAFVQSEYRPVRAPERCILVWFSESVSPTVAAVVFGKLIDYPVHPTKFLHQ